MDQIENHKDLNSTNLTSGNGIKKESLKYTLSDRWLSQNILELRSARLPLEMAYQAYLNHCRAMNYPPVPIQGFHQSHATFQMAFCL